MADIFDFYVLDNRKINFEIAEPIMREDKGVTDWVFHIPKILNGIDMSTWAWWLVYTNAKNQKHKEALVLSDDPESPLDISVGTYTVDYGMSIKAGSVQFALEAVNAVITGGEISGEWHTLTYKTTVKETLQGSEVEIDESQSDIISALIQQIQNKYNALVGGATPLPVNLKSLMTDHDKVYLYTGLETRESTGYWYYWNGTDFVPGGLYAAGIQIDPTLSQSGQGADAKTTGMSLHGIQKINFENVTDITGELLYMMESGYIRVSSGAMTFQANTANMRTPQNYPVTLKAGDVFTLNDANYRYQYLYNNGGTTWATTGWKTAAFTVGTDTQAYIIIGTADNTTISDIPALLKAVTVTRAYNATYKREVKRQGAIRNISLAPNTIPYTLECGYIRVASGITTFEDLQTTLRTTEDAPVTLSPRDTISVASGYRYQYIYLNDAGTAWTGTGWKTVDWQMPASVFRTGYIVVGKADNSVIGDDAGIYKAVTITHTVHKADFVYQDFYDSSHRGYQYIAPESTRASFSLAKKYGYNTIECDIRLTSDNYMVIHHNEGMPSNSSYLIAEHTLAELRSNANMGSYNGVVQEILTIDDLLMLCKALDLNVFIELKATLTDAQKTALVQKIKSAGMSQKAFIICNVNDATYIYRANDEYIGLLLNHSAVDSYITGLVNGKGITAIYNQSSNITAQAIQDAHNAGVKAIGWCVTYTSFGYTEETAKAEILRCINAGIDGMTIDQWTCANLVSDIYGI